jgi:hypothetical protein
MSAELLNNVPSDAIDVEAEFRRLADWWGDEAGYLSDLTKAYAHPAYRQIVALGPAVVPVLLRDLERKPAWWLPALRELTGANPVDPADRGNLRRMSEAWVKWGRENGMI